MAKITESIKAISTPIAFQYLLDMEKIFKSYVQY